MSNSNILDITSDTDVEPQSLPQVEVDSAAQLDHLEHIDSGFEAEEDVESLDPTQLPEYVLYHKSPVYSLDFYHKEGTPFYLLVGDGDDTLTVYDFATKSIIKAFSFEESVVFAKFSPDYTSFCAVGMSGEVKIVSVETMEVNAEFNLYSDVTALEWHPSSKCVVLGDASGNCWVYTAPKWQVFTIVPGSAPVTSLLVVDNKRICTGYEDGSVKVWSPSPNGPTIIGEVEDTNDQWGPILSFALAGEMVFIGTLSGILLNLPISARKFREQRQLNPHMDSIESLIFKDGLLFSCSVDGEIRSYDINTMSLRASIKEFGFTSLVDAGNKLIAAGTVEGSVHIRDSRSLELLFEIHDHVDTIFAMSSFVTGNERFVVSGCASMVCTLNLSTIDPDVEESTAVFRELQRAYEDAMNMANTEEVELPIELAKDEDEFSECSEPAIEE
ncbi:hypothetical protein PCE1_002245 [Barthelona sp. PCE]